MAAIFESNLHNMIKKKDWVGADFQDEQENVYVSRVFN